ncbi:hypothetical protein [uncultured Martelella sp.]|uniref:hypothetical protein n=1 Tax=uncultured Martelella sp. TaxID=392331 RepID=UPI0029C6FEF7|nr:hypothetical protein [uncultured Martelella sp.]
MSRKNIALAAAVFVAATVNAAHADYLRWSVEIEEDPFDNKGRLIMNYYDSADQGLLLLCEQESDTVIFRVATTYPTADGVTDRPINFGIIVDKFESHLGFARAGVLGDDLVGIDFELNDESARRLLDEMKAGQNKIYIKLFDGDPIAAPLTGSTRAATQAIEYCLTSASLPD